MGKIAILKKWVENDIVICSWCNYLKMVGENAWVKMRDTISRCCLKLSQNIVSVDNPLAYNLELVSLYLVANKTSVETQQSL